LGAVEAFVNPLLEDVRESVLTKIHDPKSLLQEWAQAQKMHSPHYRTTSTTGPDHAKEFDVEVEVGGQIAGHGQGTSKHAAEQAAATDALKNLGVE
jgi:ribonuclease-3